MESFTKDGKLILAVTVPCETCPELEVLDMFVCKVPVREMQGMHKYYVVGVLGNPEHLLRLVQLCQQSVDEHRGFDQVCEINGHPIPLQAAALLLENIRRAVLELVMHLKGRE